MFRHTPTLPLNQHIAEHPQNNTKEIIHNSKTIHGDFNLPLFHLSHQAPAIWTSIQLIPTSIGSSINMCSTSIEVPFPNSYGGFFVTSVLAQSSKCTDIICIVIRVGFRTIPCKMSFLLAVEAPALALFASSLCPALGLAMS